MSAQEANAAASTEAAAPETVAPAAPTKVEYIPKPDKAAHEKVIAEIQAEIKKGQDRLNEIRKEMDALQSGRSGMSEKIQASKAKFNEIRAERQKAMEERNEVSLRLKALQGKRDEHTKQQKALRSEIRFTSAEEIEKQIDALHLKQETQSMSLMEEKNLIKEIETLKQSRKLVAKYADVQKLGDKHREDIKEVRALHNEKNAVMDKVHERLNAQKKELDALYEQNKAENGDVFPKLFDERKKVRAEVDEAYNKYRAARQQFKEDNDKYYNNLRAAREAKKEQLRKEEEEHKAAYEAKLAEYEAEMAKIHPYQDEMDIADALVSYLESTYAKELKEVAPAAKEAKSEHKELDGMKPLARKEEDFMMLGGGKKKSGKKGKKGKKAVKLSLPLAQIEAFATVGLLPPSAVEQLPESISAIKAKKEELKGMTGKKEASSDAAPKKQSGNKQAKFDPSKHSDSDKHFPSLGNGSSVASDSSNWGAGMKAPEVPAAETANNEEAEQVEEVAEPAA